MQKFVIPILLLISIGFHVEARLNKPKTLLLTASPCDSVDAKKLGADYRAKLAEVGVNQFIVVASSEATTIAGLTSDQQKTVDLSLREAYIPIADALTKKFGPTTSATDVAAIKAFFAEIAVGYREAK